MGGCFSPRAEQMARSYQPVGNQPEDHKRIRIPPFDRLACLPSPLPYFGAPLFLFREFVTVCYEQYVSASLARKRNGRRCRSRKGTGRASFAPAQPLLTNPAFFPLPLGTTFRLCPANAVSNLIGSPAHSSLAILPKLTFTTRSIDILILQERNELLQNIYKKTIL